MRQPVLCDRCAGAIGALADAAVFTRFDPDGRCVRTGLAHPRCVDALRRELEAGGERDRESSVVDRPADAFLAEATASRLRPARTTARVLDMVWHLRLASPAVGRPPARRIGARS